MGQNKSSIVSIIRNSAQRCREVIWRAQPEFQSSEALPFQLPQDVSKRCSIRWPTTLEWPTAEPLVRQIRNSLATLVPVEMSSIPQPHRGIVMFELVRDGARHPVALDYADSADRIEEAALGASALYIKMQYRTNGYGSRPGRGAAPIVPGNYVLPNRYAFSYLRTVRKIADRSPERQFDVYGRFNLAFATAVRQRMITTLKSQSAFRYRGGEVPVCYGQHLTEIARSHICIDVPGNGPFCFRLVDYLAVGACIVAVRHKTRFAVPLEEGVHVAYVREDLSDLVETCRFYLENHQARAAMQHETRRYFDRYLAKQQLGSYYLHCCLEATGAPSRVLVMRAGR